MPSVAETSLTICLSDIVYESTSFSYTWANCFTKLGNVPQSIPTQIMLHVPNSQEKQVNMNM